MIQRYTHDCGCIITVYGDGSAPPDVEYCDDHQEREPETRIFSLIRAGGESSRAKAAELIRRLDARGRRDLRATLQTLDNLIDDVWLAELRARRIAKTKGD